MGVNAGALVCVLLFTRFLFSGDICVYLFVYLCVRVYLCISLYISTCIYLCIILRY